MVPHREQLHGDFLDELLGAARAGTITDVNVKMIFFDMVRASFFLRELARHQAVLCCVLLLSVRCWLAPTPAP